jgi:hypothetical protein
VQVGLRAAIDDARRRGGSSGSADLFTSAQAQEKHTLALRSHNDSFSFRQYGTRRHPPISFFSRDPSSLFLSARTCVASQPHPRARCIAARAPQRPKYLDRCASTSAFRTTPTWYVPPPPNRDGGLTVVSRRPTIRTYVCRVCRVCRVKSALCGEVQELGFQGKSGSFLFVSGDERLVIKTISVTESKYLRKILLAYYEHTTHPTYPPHPLRPVRPLAQMRAPRPRWWCPHPTRCVARREKSFLVRFVGMYRIQATEQVLPPSPSRSRSPPRVLMRGWCARTMRRPRYW